LGFPDRPDPEGVVPCPTGWPGFALRALGHRRRRRQPSGLAPRNEGLDADGVVAQHGTRPAGPATAPTRAVVTAPAGGSLSTSTSRSCSWDHSW